MHANYHVANTLANTATCPTCVRVMTRENEREGETERESEVWRLFFLLRSSNRAAHFSFPTELKRSGNWKGDNPAAEAPQMPMKSFRDIRVLHSGPCLCISFTWGLWKKNGFIMTTPEKCFPSGSCIIVSAEMKPYCFSLDGRCQWRDSRLERERERQREREREGEMEGEEERCSMFSKCKVHWDVAEIWCSTDAHTHLPK